MPSFRGIEISIVTQSDFGRLPEYPHPEEPRFQSLGTLNTKACVGNQPASVPEDESAAASGSAMIWDSDPKISVYIPSLPGSQFWINYAVKNDPAPPGHLFFKLHMNGRHITSWGINPKIKSKGCVEKALYEPCDRWNQEESGVVFKHEGIEARYFYFVSDQQLLSVADDGGLIEVHVFRAKGRKRRAAKLDHYRRLDKYGITAPSGGLVDNPQDVTFFDFLLIDPKDQPFATFQFHYRSLENLRQLNLTSTDDTSIPSVPLTGGAASVVESISKTSFTILEDSSCIEEQLASDCQGLDESVFDDSTPSVAQVTPVSVECRSRQSSCYILRTPPQLLPRTATSHKLPQPSKIMRDALTLGFSDAYLSRALPELPPPEIPTDGPNDTYVPRSRKSSTASAAPSIAPSLLSYVKNTSYMEETVEYGQGLEISINREYPGVPINEESADPRTVDSSICGDVPDPIDTPSVIDITTSNHEGSPLINEDSNNNDPTISSPGNYKASTGAALKGHTFQGSEDKQASSDEGTVSSLDMKSPRIKRGDTIELAIDLSRFPHLHLSESEWMRQTPSPQRVPRRILSPRLGRLWNTLRRNKSRSPLRNIREPTASRNYSTTQLLDFEVETKRKMGNWI